MHKVPASLDNKASVGQIVQMFVCTQKQICDDLRFECFEILRQWFILL